ncbi:DUF4124 domain-containing protein [Herbaspirillum robiniae]|uniref:DUF4124 domain-containing protein n=1 Tax=Herbaspirillum robiniae TaxID=2014887 RepID=UPI001EDB984F|nr:DUF4124 domain-containing protein [Herbaspirillum robiniae]
MIACLRFLLIPLALCAVALPCRAALYKCTEGGATVYADQPCSAAQAPAITPAPLPVVPALKTPPTPPRAKAEAAPAARRDTGPSRAEAAAKKKCDKLALRRRWAEQDLQETRSQPLRAQDKKLENARRKARRADEQYRLECPAPA